jgi:alpha-N-arabinofuranosidase
MPDAKLVVRGDQPIGTISPRLYGQFAEHLGRCCYDGFWVGAQCDTVEHQGGMRLDVLNALKALPMPLLRWPGGCYADHYHWRDGIGPYEERPRRLGTSCGLIVEDDNNLGTHEFINLCIATGAEPYLAGNMGSGSVQEMCDWVEYCNSRFDTTLTRLRAANGSPAPFNVRLWGVGNENWGCGGNYDAVGYAHEYKRYATMLRHIDPTIELVACGQEDDWNIALLQTLSRRPHWLNDARMSHLSIHRYWIHGGPEANFTQADYYNLLNEAAETEAFVARTAEIIRSEAPGRRIGIALDEWGVWHPEARTWGPGEEGSRRSPVTYEQANTLRDALAAAIALEGFHHQCNVLTLANLAQTVNVLQSLIMTDGPTMWLTPTYHVFKLHAPHIGATALRVETDQAATAGQTYASVSGTASRSTNGQTAVTLINRSWDAPASVGLSLGETFASASGQLLTADRPHAANSPDAPDAVSPVAMPVHADGQNWRVELPPHSMATVVFQ